MFQGIETFAFYMWSCWVSAGLGLLVVLYCMLRPTKRGIQKLVLLSIIKYLNIFYLILFIILCVLDLIRIGAFFDLLIVVNLVVVIASIVVKNKIKNRQAL